MFDSAPRQARPRRTRLVVATATAGLVATAVLAAAATDSGREGPPETATVSPVAPEPAGTPKPTAPSTAPVAGSEAPEGPPPIPDGVCDDREPADAVDSARQLDERLDATAQVAPPALAQALADYRTVADLRRRLLEAAGWDPAAVDPAVAAAAVAPYAASLQAVEEWWARACDTPPRGGALEALVAAGVAPKAAECVAARLGSFPDVAPDQLTSALAACGVDPETVPQ